MPCWRPVHCTCPQCRKSFSAGVQCMRYTVLCCRVSRLWRHPQGLEANDTHSCICSFFIRSVRFCSVSLLSMFNTAWSRKEIFASWWTVIFNRPETTSFWSFECSVNADCCSVCCISLMICCEYNCKRVILQSCECSFSNAGFRNCCIPYCVMWQHDGVS